MQCEGRDQCKEDDTIAGYFRGNYVLYTSTTRSPNTRKKKYALWSYMCKLIYTVCWSHILNFVERDHVYVIFICLIDV